MTDVLRVAAQEPMQPWRRLLTLVVRALVNMMRAPAWSLSSPVVRFIARKRRTGNVVCALGSPGFPLGRANRALDGVRVRGIVATPSEAISDQLCVARDVPRAGATPFAVFKVEPGFAPLDYPAVFAALQRPGLSKLWDLTRPKQLELDIFPRLAATWTAPPGSVPPLGVVLSFARWAALRNNAVAALQPLTTKGVSIEFFYPEQDGRPIAGWFAHGIVIHNPRAVIETLARRSRDGAMSPTSAMEIEALSHLVRGHTRSGERPALLTDLAGLAVLHSGPDLAARLAYEALSYLPQVSSATRGRALRELGTAQILQGDPRSGLKLLDEAVSIASVVYDTETEAIALCRGGTCALNRGDLVGAQRRLRRAIELLRSARDPDLLASAYHALAEAIMAESSTEAEVYATAAFALRPDKASLLADGDRSLLAELRYRSETSN